MTVKCFLGLYRFYVFLNKASQVTDIPKKMPTKNMKIKHKDKKFKSAFTAETQASEEARRPDVCQLLLSKTSGNIV